MIIDITIIIVVCAVLYDHGRPVLAAIALVGGIERISSIGAEHALVQRQSAVVHVVLLLHQYLFVACRLALRCILRLHQTVILMKHTLRTHVPISLVLLLLLVSGAVAILYLVYQIRLTSDRREPLPIDAANEAVRRFLTERHAADAGLDAGDAIASNLIIYLCCIVPIVAVSIDNIDNHEIIIHLVKYWLLLIANLGVVTAATPSEHTLDATGHRLGPLHRTDETVVHSIICIRIVVSLHAHNV